MSKNVIAKNGIKPLKRAIAAGEKLAAQFFLTDPPQEKAPTAWFRAPTHRRAASRWTSQRKERVRKLGTLGIPLRRQ